MKHITYTCDRCGKSVNMLYNCYMHYEKYYGVNLEDPKETNSIELCKNCLEEYKSIFNKKKTALGKEEE